jgi:hypothetical protein
MDIITSIVGTAVIMAVVYVALNSVGKYFGLDK